MGWELDEQHERVGVADVDAEPAVERLDQRRQPDQHRIQLAAAAPWSAGPWLLLTPLNLYGPTASTYFARLHNTCFSPVADGDGP